MIASLSPKTRKVQNNDRCIGQEDPDCFFYAEIFFKNQRWDRDSPIGCTDTVKGKYT